MSELVTGLLRFSRCELLVEAWDSLETQRKGNIRRCKPLPSNVSENVTVDTNVCGTLIREL
jgi:hypothetical protein